MKKFNYVLAALLLLGGIANAAENQAAVPDVHGLWIQPPPDHEGAVPTSRNRLGALQLFFFKQEGNQFWGIVCNGPNFDPCSGNSISPIQDGKVDGNDIVFYIDHPDLSTGRFGGQVYRNMFIGKLQGNMIVFEWMREPGGPQDGRGGKVRFIGPITTSVRPAPLESSK